MSVKLIYSEEFLAYRETGHPESPERLKAIKEFLAKKNSSFEFIRPIPCEEEDLLLAHTEDLIKKVKENDFYDPDTPNIPNIYYYAKLSCGAAVQAAFIAMGGEIAISLGRPPGHHSGKNTLGGFCYFNNMAVAVRKVLSGRKLKLAVLDIDGHHGNGTEEILNGEKNLLYLSLHQSPAFPGTGNVSFGNCYNFPVLPNTDAKIYMGRFKEAVKILKDFSPDMLGISAGFDAHRNDPLLNLNLLDAHYYQMGKEIAGLCEKTFVLLEGGYNIESIGNTCYSFINGLTRG
jgi:acetoin utilization deacetylase AcuC-like enzyme